MRDFLYVSERKIDRIAATLPPRVARRLKELKFNAGPVGAGVVFADQRAETAVASVIEVEKAIRAKYSIRNALDPDLTAGDWFSAEAMNMLYGVQVANEDPGPGAAVFIGETSNNFIFLSGSAEYLLDRSTPQADAGDSMSDPQAIARLLESVAKESSHLSSPYDPADTAWDFAYAIENLYYRFRRFGQQPLGFLARAIDIIESDRRPRSRQVVGTPLFVEFATAKSAPRAPK
jgi:hypothetical protein